MKSRKGMGMSPRGMTEEERFWSKVDKSAGPDGCWEWTAGHNVYGYGVFFTSRGNMGAHRVAYELSHGPIADGLCVCHHCDNPDCVNPAHLFLGTNRDNVRDRTEKGRSACGDRAGLRLHPETRACGERNGAYTHPETRARGKRNGAHTHPESHATGERAGGAKLVAAQVLEIKAKYASGQYDCRKLAEMYGIGKSQVWNIVSGRSWKHLEGGVQ